MKAKEFCWWLVGCLESGTYDEKAVRIKLSKTLNIVIDTGSPIPDRPKISIDPQAIAEHGDTMLDYLERGELHMIDDDKLDPENLIELPSLIKEEVEEDQK
jgi:hypothetical protein